MKLKILAYFMLLSVLSFAQTPQDSITISGQLVGNNRFAKVVVKKFGVSSFDIAAAEIRDEKFKITAPLNIAAGVYRLQYGQFNESEYIDVIIDGKEKNISFTLEVYNSGSMPVFTASEENKKWYAYQQKSTTQLIKIEVLNQVLANYPSKTDEIVVQTNKAVNEEKAKYKQTFTAFCKENKNTWAGAMVQNKPYYFTNPTEDVRLQNYYRKEHYWDGIEASNPKLINSPLYTEHILNYLRYYMNPDMKFSDTERDEGFIKSVDTIMQKFGKNEDTKKMALQYLQLGFKEIGIETVLKHIDETYAETLAQCNDDTSDKLAFETRMAGYEALKKGNAAPNSTLHLSDETTQKLYEVENDMIVLVFWASWCPNCEEQMPSVEAYAKTHKKVSVVAISLDEDKAAYAAAIKKFPNLLHSCDYKKWEGTAVSDYYIYGTPTFIVLDEDHKILGKFSSWKGAEASIENINQK